MAKQMVKQLFLGTIADLLHSESAKRMKQYRQHGKISTFDHSLNVAYCSYALCVRFFKKANATSVARGAFLHDFYLYDWHKTSGVKFHGIFHPAIALKNAQQYFELNDIEKNIISSHMWPLTLRALPRCKESLIVCIIDKWCAINETFGRIKININLPN